MNADQLIKTLTEIQRRWLYNRVLFNCGPWGEKRRRDDVPWSALIVEGDLGPVEGHECVVYDPAEGCSEEGHDNYQYVGWIDSMGRATYVDVVSPQR